MALAWLTQRDLLCNVMIGSQELFAVCISFSLLARIHDHPAIEIRFNQSRISANFNDRAELPPSAFPSLLHPQTSFTNSMREATA